MKLHNYETKCAFRKEVLFVSSIKKKVEFIIYIFEKFGVAKVTVEAYIKSF